ncbi:2-dehydro-3-deoxy-D-gluconate 5-dehydrogenase KduD [Metabacillus idriensis]|uniref:2-dehydro-3-deoxy-D-gluconate 5-dehydrogenase KduD n=1 Tax=Metabacillus idriensis TaxID=324768 RepID=UPI00296738DC|nr:2-dehydro-3-deoxy-D-gluconate 5-dehydrogenase KduD [Metabacillus idriensis]
MNEDLRKSFSLEGKTALITGVSRGLGQGMAIGLAKAGAAVIGAGVSDMTSTKEAVERIGKQFFGIQADLSESGGAENILAKAIQFSDSIDILINSSGIIRRSNAEEYTMKDWNDVMQVNLNSLFEISSVVGSHMLQKGSGKIINIASMLSFQGGIRVPAYTASKHGVAGLTKALANEWGGKGICVNAIAPGYMATDNTEALREDEARSTSILSRIPLARWGTPEDLVGPAVFLASDASNYVNGHILCVDGGWMSY